MPTATPAPKTDTRSEARKALDARNAELAALAVPKVLVRQRQPVPVEDLAPGETRKMVRNTTISNPQKRAAKAAAAARKATRKQRILAHAAAQS